jgi:hypothetical protein
MHCTLVMKWVVISFVCASVAKAVSFTDVTQRAGVDYLQSELEVSARTRAMTGGAAAGDFDNDGWTDLFVTRLGAPDILFRNQRDGSFKDVSASAFPALSPIARNDYSNGAAWGDVDNDGDLDLYVSKVESTRHYLYINNGDGTFTEDALRRNAAVSKPDTHFGYGVALGDYDLDGFLDLAVGEWRHADWDDTPHETSPSNARLLRNLGAAAPGGSGGFFTDTTDQAHVSMQLPSGDVWAFSPRFRDLNRDGYPELTYAADFGTSRLFWNNGDGTFQDGTEAAGVGIDQNGMGSTFGDFDGDGDWDWFVTSIYGDPEGNWQGKFGNRLYQNNGDGGPGMPSTFTDITEQVGVQNGGWGWGTTFLDYDNDGDTDLAMTNGWQDIEFVIDQTRLFEYRNGVFHDVATELGIDDVVQGRALLKMDYDRDGDQDIFIVGNAGLPVLYRNDGGNENHWLQIETVGRLSNRDGIGAVITVIPDEAAYDPQDPAPGTFMIREIDGGTNYLSQDEMLAHFGLGDAGDMIDLVRVQWPSGVVQEFTNIMPDDRYVAIELRQNLVPKDRYQLWMVPEPSASVLIFLASLGWLSFRNRRPPLAVGFSRQRHAGERPSPVQVEDGSPTGHPQVGQS